MPRLLVALLALALPACGSVAEPPPPNGARLRIEWRVVESDGQVGTWFEDVADADAGQEYDEPAVYHEDGRRVSPAELARVRAWRLVHVWVP